MLTVAIPGVTLPFDQLVYLWIGKSHGSDAVKSRGSQPVVAGISLSVGFHEFGHALAAAAMHVRSTSIGFFWILFFPGAYVEIEPNGFAALAPRQRLRITAAGELGSAFGVCFAWPSILSGICVDLLQGSGTTLCSLWSAPSCLAALVAPSLCIIAGLRRADAVAAHAAVSVLPARLVQSGGRRAFGARCDRRERCHVAGAVQHAAGPSVCSAPLPALHSALRLIAVVVHS